MARDRDRDSGTSGGGDSGGGGDRGGKGKGGGGREIELAADPNFLWRFIKANVSAAANDIGRAGYDIGAVKAALDAAEGLLGPRLVGISINAVAAAVQEPQIMKEFVRRFGWPEQINALADEFIDDLFEGLRMGLRDSHKRLHEDTVKKGERTALDNLRGKLSNLHFLSFDDALGHLSAAQQIILTEGLLKLNPDQRKAFHSTYRSKVAAGGIGALRALILAMNGRTGDQIMQYLELMYGAPAPSAANTVIDSMVGALKRVDAAARKHLGVADPDNDPVADRMWERARTARRRTSA